MNRQPKHPDDSPEDLLDEAMRVPVVNAGVTRLHRVLAPSCLASLVIVLLLTILFRRWVHLPPIGMVLLLLVVWGLTLGALVRFRNPDPDGESESGHPIDGQ